MSESFIDLKCNKSCRHIRELEQQLSELKESQKQKQIIILCNRLDKAKQQNKRMLEALIFEYKFIKEWASAALPEKIFDELLKIKKDAIEAVTDRSIDELLK